MLARMAPTDHRQIGRRTVLRASLAGALLVPATAALQACGAAGTGGPATSTGLIANRPRLTHGVASGDPRTDGALVWARSDSPRV